MAAIRKIDPDRLEIRRGGGVGIALFGAPFLAVGLLAISIALGLLPTASPRASSVAAGTVFGLAFTAVGAAAMFGRSWTIIDGTSRTITSQLGLLRPLWQWTRPLDRCDGITLGFVRGDSDTADSFTVSLTTAAGGARRVCSFSSYADARACAVAIAEHLRLDLEDASTDHPVRVTAADAELPFQQRIRRDRGPAACEAPADMQSVVTRDADEVRIVMPAPRAHPFGLIFGLTPLAIFVFVGTSMSWLRFPRGGVPVPVLMFAGFFVFLCVVLPISNVLGAILRARFGGTIVTASPRGIRVEERGAIRTRTVATFDADDIFDLDYSTRESTIASAERAVAQRMAASGGATTATLGPKAAWLLSAVSKLAKGSGLTIKARQGLTTVGANLPDDELRYVHSLIRQALRG